MDKPSWMAAKKAALKQIIIEFLNTCENRRCQLNVFWNEVARFQKKPLSHKQYGVSKMHKLLTEFQDVLTCQNGFVHLLSSGPVASHTTRKDVIEISDSDEEENLNDSFTSSLTFSATGSKMSHTSERGQQAASVQTLGSPMDSRSNMISVLNDKGGKCGIWTFLDCYSSLYGPVNDFDLLLRQNSDVVLRDGDNLILKPDVQRITTRGSGSSDLTTMKQWGSGFTSGAEEKPSPSSSVSSSAASQSKGHHSPSVSSLASNFIPFSGDSPVPAGQGQGQLSHQRYGLPPFRQRPSPVPELITSNLATNFPPASANLIGAPLLAINMMQPFSAVPLPGQSPQMARFASPAAMLPADTHRPVQSEWPKPVLKTGPTPGTKITEETKEIIVRPMTLPRGIRLTSDQVNQQVQECIDILSESREHVSLERIETLLLQKYKVRNFRDLNLREKYFEALPAARDHSMKLGKVNSYIQNFVRSRSLCTLYELKECCRDFHPDNKDFDHLKLGPLQKMPMIYDQFKFPLDEYIPDITSIDIMEQLNNYLDRYDKWRGQTNLEEFMKFLMTEVYQVTSAYSLGVRLRSLPLAIQMLKKSKRDAASTRKLCIESLKEILNRDVQEAFTKFRANILQTCQDGSLELRRHYMNLPPEEAVRQILTKFELLTQIIMTSSTSQHRKIERLQKHFNTFVESILDVPVPRQLFHLSICMSDLEVYDSAKQFLEQETRRQEEAATAAAQKQQETSKREKTPPTKGGLTEKIVSYLNRCLEQGSLHLSHLSRIEVKLLEDLDFSNFQELGYGRFLEFILADSKIKQLLEECGGTVLGSSAAGHEAESVYKPSHTEVLELICQVKHAGITQVQQLEKVLCEQYLVAEVKHLGQGNITRLCQAAEKTSGKHWCGEYRVQFEAALCGKSCPSTGGCGRVGVQGNQTRDAAMACLTACPLLEDLAEWSHWLLVFQPQHGRIRDFIEKHGGQKEITLAGGEKTAISDFLALEIAPGKLLKISSTVSPEQLVAALDRQDPFATAGYLVSLIVSNRGLDNSPLALLANHVKTCLIGLHADSPGISTPGGPPTPETVVDLAVQFVTTVLLRLPLRISVSVANQVLLEPLSQVVGSAKSKYQIVQACRPFPWQRQRLELLGILLGLPEWSVTFQQRCEFPAECVTAVLKDDLLGEAGLEEEDEDEDENSDEEEEDEESSDIDDILSSGGEKSPEPISDQRVETEGNRVDPEDQGVSSSEHSDQSDESEDDDDDDDEEGEENDEDEKEQKGTTADDGETREQTEMQVCEEGVDTAGSVEARLEDRQLTRSELCQQVVEDIRREEFGVGIQLDLAGQKLMQKQQERQGRSLQRLSKDLYSKDTHFVLELIQNADDNTYPEQSVPAVKFVIDATGVRVLNNECGFEERNIRALCDVGKSTKSKHQLGYIGQKGIGFKSVFRVTDCPEVHSNGFHICFDVSSGPMGYILPHWMDQQQTDPEWQTSIILPWTEEIKQQVKSHAARFNDIQPSLLLFLHRLKEITIDNKVEGFESFMCRQDLPDGEVQITHSFGMDRWLVLRKILDASTVSLQMKSGADVETTEIALAFPLLDQHAALQSQARLNRLPVYAFLPLRSYGFKFIVQGDFDVPSSREDVDRDSSWNQWLRSEIPTLFIEALQAFKAREELSPLQAVIQYLQFVPLEGEVMDFFRPVASQILNQLRAIDCMPVLTTDKKDLQWKMPSKTVVTHDALVLEIVSPDVLQRDLGLFYLHPDVGAVLDPPLVQALGVESVTTEHLLHIGRSIGQNWSSSQDTGQVTELAKWLACVYRSLDDFQDNQPVMDTLYQMRVIPLTSGQLVSLSDVTVFLLMDGFGQPVSDKVKKRGPVARDPLQELKKDLNLVHTELTNTPDNEVNSQVVKLLIKMGIKQMTAQDLVHGHIMPIFTSDQWKEKSPGVLISYVAYIKSELERNPSLVDLVELKPVVRLVTNHGIQLPSQHPVHFSTAFHNKIDLQNVFPGLEWTLVDSAYLPRPTTQLDIQSWRDFFTQLDVVDFLCVKKIELHFDKSKIQETAWAPYKDVWPDSPDGYTITDFECEEFHQLVTCNKTAQHSYKQMTALYQLLDQHWTDKYKRLTVTQLRSGSGHVLKDILETSFAIHLKSLAWIPSIWKNVEILEDNRTVESVDVQDLLRPADLYVHDPSIEDLLAHTVKYLNVSTHKDSSFSKFLQIKTSVDVSTVSSALISWCERNLELPDKPRMFCTTMKHVYQLYTYLTDHLAGKQCQDLFHNNPVIFYPVLSRDQRQTGQLLVGQMLTRKEVWWSDRTGLFTKYRESLEVYRSPLSKRKVLEQEYSPLDEMFHSLVRVSPGPNTLDLAQLLKHVATVHSLSEDSVLTDTLYLFSKIGSDLSKISCVEAGVKTMEAQDAEVHMESVKELLTKAAVFPTKQDQWVSLSDYPMIVDSTEFEQMFMDKPGVHFLQLESRESSKHWGRVRRGYKSDIDEESLQYFLSLFEAIQPLRACVQTEEITSGFQQCIKGQNYLHKIVGPLQKFLYFVYPEVYCQVKDRKAGTFKELLFTQVKRLEVRYQLIDRPDVYIIREEKCVVKDKHFYFHEKYVSSQEEIIKEVAKFFSEGDEECQRELRTFLVQVSLILDGESDEPIDEFLKRQRICVGQLPPEEDIWEIPLPIIPEPEPVQETVLPMVYGRALSMPEAISDGGDGPDDKGDKQGMKAWPPRSGHLDKENPAQSRRSDGETKCAAAAGIWPPPQAANYSTLSKQLPSNIRVEKNDDDVSQANSDSGSKVKSERSRAGVSSLASQTGASRQTDRQTSQSGEGRSISRQSSQTSEDQGQVRQTLERDGDTADPKAYRQTGKRKLTDGSRGDDSVAVKRLNSQDGNVTVKAQVVGENNGGQEMELAVDAGEEVRIPGQHPEEKMEEGEGPGVPTSQEVVMPQSSSSLQGTRPASKKGTLQFTIPIWNDYNEDIAYTELASGDALTVPPDLSLDKGMACDIGLWGERLVQDYLMRQKAINSEITDVHWANAEGEKGLPYDFEIVCRDDKTEETHKIFVEVKATVSWHKEVFQVSSNQLEFALVQRDGYQIYRVFGAGSERPKIVRVENVAEKMRTHAVRMFMVL